LEEGDRTVGHARLRTEIGQRHRLEHRLSAAEIGIPSAAAIPALIWIVVPVVVVAANVIGALPARAAARTMPAAVLRSE
jgi:hypothetical protein